MRQVEKRRSLFSLDWVVFFMADVETGIGPFVSTYLSSAFNWNPAQIGMIIGSQSFAAILAQTPAGFAIDHAKRKKWLLAIAAVIISFGAITIASVPSVALQIANEIGIGIASAFVSPTVAAISLGMVGRAAFSRRVGRNAAFSHSGNVVTALFAGVVGAASGQQWIFYVSAALGAVVVLFSLLIRDEDIDNDAASERAKDSSEKPSTEVFQNTQLGLFAFLVVLFHFANAAMLPLAGQELGKAVHGKSSTYMAACIVIAQLVMVPTAYLVGRNADTWGRKPLFLFAFAVLTLRGILFASGHAPDYIVAVELLDGLGTGTSGVISLLIVSDLAKGTGRFNFMQGIMQASVGAGAFLGNSVAGLVAKAAGFPTAFLMLAAVAVIGGAVFAIRMPETRQS